MKNKKITVIIIVLILVGFVGGYIVEASRIQQEVSNIEKKYVSLNNMGKLLEIQVDFNRLEEKLKSEAIYIVEDLLVINVYEDFLNEVYKYKTSPLKNTYVHYVAENPIRETKWKTEVINQYDNIVQLKKNLEIIKRNQSCMDSNRGVSDRIGTYSTLSVENYVLYNNTGDNQYFNLAVFYMNQLYDLDTYNCYFGDYDITTGVHTYDLVKEEIYGALYSIYSNPSSHNIEKNINFIIVYNDAVANVHTGFNEEIIKPTIKITDEIDRIFKMYNSEIEKLRREY